MQVTGVQAIREAQLLDLAEPTSYTGVYELLTATVINDHKLSVPDELRGSKPRGFPSITALLSAAWPQASIVPLFPHQWNGRQNSTCLGVAENR